MVTKRRYALIGVEGNHDQAFLSKVLCKLLGFTKFRDGEDTMDSLWRKFRPVYPPKNGKFYVRLNLPSIMYKENISVAVYAGGGSNLGPSLSTILSNMDVSELYAFGIVADSDKSLPRDVARDYCSVFNEFFPDFPNFPGQVFVSDSVRSGIYILPDNTSDGVLETLLCKCGEAVYPDYMQRALSYIEKFSEEEVKALKWKPFDKDKAIVATVASVLKPGKTNTVSISDNKWVCQKTLESIPEMSLIVDFLRRLLM